MMSSHLPWGRSRGQPIAESPSLPVPPPVTAPLINTRLQTPGAINKPKPRPHWGWGWTHFRRNLFEDVDVEYWDAQATQSDEDSPKTEEVEDVLKAQDDGFNEEVDVVVVEKDIDPVVPTMMKNVSHDSNLGNALSVSPLRRATYGWSRGWDLEKLPTNDQPASTFCMIKFGQTFCRSVVRGLKLFFYPTFPEEAAEERFRRERFNQMKFLAVAGSCLIFMNWLFIVCLIPTRKMILPDKIFYWGIAPWLVIPIPVFIYCNWPRKYPCAYQVFTSVALWAWSAYSLFLIQLCGYYDPTDKIIDCQSKDFLNLLFYTSAFPAIGVFGLGQTRTMATITALFNATLIGSIIRYRTTWIRILLLYILYTAFLVGAHYVWERDCRRVYRMRDELKTQVRQAQLARDRGARLEKSKRSLTSYIFHELRVPLNIANLARGNLLKEGGIHPDFSVEAEALGHSLESMTQVLNDVLDFHRMESGKFRCVRHPYAFHRTLGAALQGLALGAEEKGIRLQREFDHDIDVLADHEMLLAMDKRSDLGDKEPGGDESGRGGKNSNIISDEESGIIVGDANRLRQIMNNLVSNAIKFTDRGGMITVRTKSLGCCWPLVADAADGAPLTPKTSNCNAKSSSVDLEPLIQQQDPDATDTENTRCRRQMVIRIEVEDSGAGIQKKWVVDNRLFSPYVQTELGRLQGGKGSGLGLALIKNIVKFSGGRLGVRSQFTKGSTFWVELPVGIGPIQSPKPSRAIPPVLQPAERRTGPPQLGGDASQIGGNGPPTGGSIVVTTSEKRAGPALSGSKSSDQIASLAKPPSPKKRKSAPQTFDPPLDVLVVDDDPMTRKLMERMLTRNGCKVSTSDNGRSALEMALGVSTPCLSRSPTPSLDLLRPPPSSPHPTNTPQQYDIMFVDNQMPIMSGVEMVRNLRVLGRKDMLIGVTGNALKEDQLEYLQAGANGVLIKPVQERQLVDYLVQAAVERTRRLASSPQIG